MCKIGFQTEILPAVLYKRGDMKWLNQPHKHYKEKNEMLYNLKQVILDSKYMGWTVDSKSREGIVRSHIFETESVSWDRIKSDISYIW